MTECADKYESSDHFHFADPEEGGYGPGSFASQVAVQRHQNTTTYLFADGHVERLNWIVVKPRLTTRTSAFINPIGNP
jgi:prepilin-type processing-associated H-X9-DG protein